MPEKSIKTKATIGTYSSTRHESLRLKGHFLQVNFGDSSFMAFDSNSGPPKIQIELRKCDRMKLKLDFPALFMTRPGGTGTDVTVKVKLSTAHL